MDTHTTTRFLHWVRETLELGETLSGSADAFERHLGRMLRADVETALTPPSAEACVTTAAPHPETVPRRRGRAPGSRLSTHNKPSSVSPNGEGSEGEPSDGVPFGDNGGDGDGEPTTATSAQGEGSATEGSYVNNQN